MKRMIKSSLNPNLLDWTYGTEYEGRKQQLAYDIVKTRQSALDSGNIDEWKSYRSWIRRLCELYSNIFDNTSELEEWALKQIKYKNAY